MTIQIKEIGCTNTICKGISNFERQGVTDNCVRIKYDLMFCLNHQICFLEYFCIQILKGSNKYCLFEQINELNSDLQGKTYHR